MTVNHLVTMNNWISLTSSQDTKSWNTTQIGFWRSDQNDRGDGIGILYKALSTAFQHFFKVRDRVTTTDRLRTLQYSLHGASTIINKSRQKLFIRAILKLFSAICNLIRRSARSGWRDSGVYGSNIYGTCYVSILFLLDFLFFQCEIDI